ncbi:uncharacterized protein LOC107019149 [Solanum pennellii]|uniref:Uncharacterized protein LOC107019149 n=1 Tax=Solanum pennellii TaxID=28526 RepID=A0ABM1GSF3_SOLPN|nr:uncharacterized protein LOC107019149 [Solanum pennellii]
MPVNPAWLTDAEVRASLAHMAQAMIAQINWQNVERENPLVLSRAKRLRDFTRMNPPIFTGSKNLEDPQEFVDEVEDSRKKRGVHDARRTNPQDQERPIHGGQRNNFGVCEQPRLKKGQQSSGNSNSQRITTLRGGRPEPKKGNGGEMQRPKKNCAKCGRAHSGECRHGTNAYFGCGKSGHMVRDCPQNIGRAGEVDPRKTEAVKNWPKLLLPQISVAYWEWQVTIAGKANIVTDALSGMSMGITTHIEDEKK